MAGNSLGVSKARNERLANLFYRLQLIEAFGTGIMKIKKAYKYFHLQPEFIATQGAFVTRLPKLYEEPNTQPHNTQKNQQDANLITPMNQNMVNESQAPYAINLLDEQQVNRAILDWVHEKGAITRKQLQERYGFKQTKSGIILKNLEESGKLVKKGTGKNTFYEGRHSER